MVRELAIFFSVGLGLLAARHALHDGLAPGATGRTHDTAAGRHDVRALLAESALEAGAPLKDPVLRERLLTLLAADQHDAPPSDAALLAMARELDLFHRDSLLEARLAAHAELRIKASIAHVEPSRAELLAYLARHRPRYQRSERFSFVQLLLARDRHPDPGAAALALREQLEAEQAAPLSSPQRGDPNSLPRHVLQSSRRSVESRFGATIAAALPTLTRGSWSQPLASPLGMHLIWLLDHQPAAPAELDEVQSQLRADFVEEVRERAYAERLSQLRAERAAQEDD